MFIKQAWPGTTHWTGRLSTVDLFIKVTSLIIKVKNIFSRNTKGECITVPLTSCLTGLDKFVCKKICQLSYSWFQTSQTGGQQYNDTSPFSIPCFQYKNVLVKNSLVQGGQLYRAFPLNKGSLAWHLQNYWRSFLSSVPYHDTNQDIFKLTVGSYGTPTYRQIARFS